MSQDVERLEAELRNLRNRVQTLETENYQLRARAAKCTCAAAMEISTPASTPNDEQQIDIFAGLGVLDCDDDP